MAFEQAAMLSEQASPSSVLQPCEADQPEPDSLVSLQCKARNDLAEVGAIECSVSLR